MKWKLKEQPRTRVRERLGPLTPASLHCAEGRCVVCGEPFRAGDYWTVVNRVEVPLLDEAGLKVKKQVNECAHWHCWQKPYRSLDAV